LCLALWVLLSLRLLLWLLVLCLQVLRLAVVRFGLLGSFFSYIFLRPLLQYATSKCLTQLRCVFSSALLTTNLLVWQSHS
jgi:hypothetical protein